MKVSGEGVTGTLIVESSSDAHGTVCGGSLGCVIEPKIKFKGDSNRPNPEPFITSTPAMTLAEVICTKDGGVVEPLFSSWSSKKPKTPAAARANIPDSLGFSAIG